MATAALLKIRSHFFTKESKSMPPGAQRHRDCSENPNHHRATSSRQSEEDQESQENENRIVGLNRRKSNDESIRPEARRRALTDTHMMRGIRQLDTICTIGTGTFGRVLLVSNRAGQQYYALKVVSIRYVVHKRQVEHVHNEKAILQVARHPFIVNLFWTWHDSKCLYLLFEFVPGGELFSYLRAAGRFSNNTARFYAAELITALEFLHCAQIVYRDLKPENLLLDKTGHIKLIDFGFSKMLATNKTFTLCGTAEYMPPEVIQQKGHGLAVDWWGLGVLIYEMMAGYPPFRGDNVLSTYERIIECKYMFPKQIFAVRENAIPKNLIKKLLVLDPAARLGGGNGGPEEVKAHRWFKGINWDDVFACRIQSPIIPKLYHDGDTGNFDQYKEFNFDDFPAAPEKELAFFKNF